MKCPFCRSDRVEKCTRIDQHHRRAGEEHIYGMITFYHHFYYCADCKAEWKAEWKRE